MSNKVQFEVSVGQGTIHTIMAYKKAFGMDDDAVSEMITDVFEKAIEQSLSGRHEVAVETNIKPEPQNMVVTGTGSEMMSIEVTKAVANKMRALELITGDNSVVISKLTALADSIVTNELRSIFAPGEPSAQIPVGSYETTQRVNQTVPVMIHKGNVETPISDADIGDGLGDDVEVDYDKEEAEFTPPKPLHKEHEFAKPRATRRATRSSRLKKAKASKVSADE